MVSGLLQLVESAHEESYFQKIPFCPQKIVHIVEKASRNPNSHAIFVVRREGTIIAGIYCTIGEYIFGDQDKICTISGLYLVPKIRSSLGGGKISQDLLNASLYWARANGAVEILVHATTGISQDRSLKFLQRSGFSILGANFAREL